MQTENDDLMFFADDEEAVTFAPAEDTAEVSRDNTAPTHSWRVLIVDDDTAVHNVTKFILRRFEFEGEKVIVEQAFSAAEAKAAIEQSPEFALILLDVVMETRTAGFDVVHYIRQEKHNNLTRIVLRTGQPGDAPEYEVIQKYDINDYKSKTELTDTKLLTTVMTSLRSYRDLLLIEEKSKLIEQKNKELEQALTDLRAAQEENIKAAALKRDIHLAGEVQRSLFPTVFPQKKGYTFTARSQPAMDVGGDLCDIIEIDDRYVACLLADVSGKGIHAAIFMAVCRTLFLTQTLRYNEPEKIAVSVNELLLRASRADKFVTAFLGILDTHNHTLSYVCAGHEPALLVRADGSIEMLEQRSRFLGLLEHPEVNSATIALHPGDSIVAVSDGVTDTRSPDGTMYQQDRLIALCSSLNRSNADTIADTILQDLSEFKKDTPLFDDTTLVVCSRSA